LAAALVAALVIPAGALPGAEGTQQQGPYAAVELPAGLVRAFQAGLASLQAEQRDLVKRRLTACLKDELVDV
jgi:hypothetical protein